MKLQIDTHAKTIVIEEAVEVGKLCDILKGLFGDDWKKWKLETRTIANWINPVTYPIYPQYPFIPLGPTWISNPTTCAVEPPSSVFNVFLTN
jgi:hypothetical protein